MKSGLATLVLMPFAGFAVLYAGLLVPKVVPSFGATVWFLLYVLAAFIALMYLVAIAGAGTTSLIYQWIRHRAVEAKVLKRTCLGISGVCAFSAILLIAQFAPSNLPSGSYLADFDQKSWRHKDPSRYVSGDITQRQKMLAAVVELLPGSNRSKIEELLGPSLETPYFVSSGRDLIYMLGPERDSFIGIDSEWLLIWLNDLGEFERYAIYTD